MSDSNSVVRFPGSRTATARTASTGAFIDRRKQTFQRHADVLGTVRYENLGHAGAVTYIKWSGDAATKPKSERENSISTARELYLTAYKEIVGRQAAAELSRVGAEEELWRLTFIVPTTLANDSEGLIELETKLHSFVADHSVEMAGSLSIQFLGNG
jgi:hypothetical protein